MLQTNIMSATKNKFLFKKIEFRLIILIECGVAAVTGIILSPYKIPNPLTPPTPHSRTSNGWPYINLELRTIVIHN